MLRIKAIRILMVQGSWILGNKLVDIDAMLQDDTYRCKLYQENLISAKEALSLFIDYFVEGDDVKNNLLQKINTF